MNRHLFGDMLPIQVDVPDCVKVVAGDLMLLCENDNYQLNVDLRTRSGQTNYAYPWASGATVSQNLSATTGPLIGVAMDDSPSGSTDTIGVATAGVFEFPLQAQAGVTVGQVVQSSVPAGYVRTAQTTASYQVLMNSSGGITLGYCVKTEAQARTIQFLLRTKYGPGGIVDV